MVLASYLLSGQLVTVFLTFFVSATGRCSPSPHLHRNMPPRAIATSAFREIRDFFGFFLGRFGGVATEDLRQRRRAGNRLADRAAALPVGSGRQGSLDRRHPGRSGPDPHSPRLPSPPGRRALHLDRFDGGHRWNGTVA